jgi:hypothetical protein
LWLEYKIDQEYSSGDLLAMDYKEFKKQLSQIAKKACFIANFRGWLKESQVLPELLCRVCGKAQSEPIWGDDGQCPTHAICDCCGTEFGYEDCNLKAIKTARDRWLTSGAKWFNPKKQPADWSLEEQLKQIPAQYK